MGRKQSYENLWNVHFRQNARHIVCFHKVIFSSRSVLNAYVDWQTRFIKILAFKTAKVAGISELI